MHLTSSSAQVHPHSPVPKSFPQPPSYKPRPRTWLAAGWPLLIPYQPLSRAPNKPEPILRLRLIQLLIAHNVIQPTIPEPLLRRIRIIPRIIRVVAANHPYGLLNDIARLYHALHILRRIPILRMRAGVQDLVAAALVCLRAARDDDGVGAFDLFAVDTALARAVGAVAPGTELGWPPLA